MMAAPDAAPINADYKLYRPGLTGGQSADKRLRDAADSHGPAGGRRPDADRIQAEYKPNTDRLQAGYRPTTGGMQTDYRSDTDRLQAGYKPTTGRIQADYRRIQTDYRRIQTDYRLTTGRIQTDYRPTKVYTIQADCALNRPQPRIINFDEKRKVRFDLFINR